MLHRYTCALALVLKCLKSLLVSGWRMISGINPEISRTVETLIGFVRYISLICVVGGFDLYKSGALIDWVFI